MDSAAETGGLYPATGVGPAEFRVGNQILANPLIPAALLALMTDLASGGMTMVVVTHEMGYARNVSDNVVFMDQGVVVETGEPEQIFTAAESERLRTFLSQVL